MGRYLGHSEGGFAPLPNLPQDAVRAAGRPRAGPRASEASKIKTAPAEPALEVERAPVALSLGAMSRLLGQATSLPAPGGPVPVGALTWAPVDTSSSGLWRDAWRRLIRNRLAVAGGVTVILLCLVAIFADFIAPSSYPQPNFGRIYDFPSRDYPLGTDQLGRDVLSRMIYGARVSMLVGLGAQVIVVLIGVPIG